MSSRSIAWRTLATLERAQIRLPSADPASVASGVFTLSDGWTEASNMIGRMHVFQRALPFACDMPKPNYAPLGARLLRGAQVIPFATDVADLEGGLGGWFVEDGQINVIAMESPVGWSDVPVLAAPELIASQKRRVWDPAAGIAPLDYVSTNVTLGAVTRPAIQLPVGGEIGWEVDVPPNASLCFGVVLLPDVVPHDNDTVEAVWTAAGVEIGRRALTATTPHEDVCTPVPAGHVALSFAGEPGAANGRGHVVFTSPVLRVPPARAVRRVVVIGIDTLRWDALGLNGYERATSPELDAFAREAVVFDHAYAPAPRTRPSFRSALTGRDPYAAIHAPTLGEHLLPLGFRTAGIVANVHLVPRFGFNNGFEYWHYDNGASAGEQVDRALAWLTEHQDEDSYLFLHLMDPHTWYHAPEPFGSRFQSGVRPDKLPKVFDRWLVYRIMTRSWFSDAHRDWIRASYDGEIAYTSHELGRLFTALDAMPGDTLTVLHSDHGEEFWDHGAFEHNHTLYDELVRAVMWIRPPGGWPGGPHHVASYVGLIDIVPTLLDILGAPESPTDGRSLRGFFDPTRDPVATAATFGGRALMIGHLMFGKERWAVIERGFKYILHTTSGQEELYDLEGDPKETRDLATTPDHPRLAPMRDIIGRASRWPVRQGWRVRLSARGLPFRVEFDAPIDSAGVIDPEADLVQRANLEWGAVPKVAIADVGLVRVSDDRREVRFAPGGSAPGHWIYLACAGACPAGRIVTDEGTVPLAEGDLVVGRTRLRARAGTLLLPTITEAEALHLPAESGQLEALRQLGYIDGD